jgi:putative SOS response-associated peptidase YedK
MCGRISTAGISADILKAHFDIDSVFPFTLSYNVAPTLQIPAIIEQNNIRKLEAFRWGLIPHWARDKNIIATAFNARAETLTQKPLFRGSIKSKRCLVLATGFYEWQKRGGKKQPYYIYRSDKRPLAFAGLWDIWEDNITGEAIESCTIITIPATHQMTQIHERMPAVLESEIFDTWLDPEFNETEVLQDILIAPKEDVLEMYPVSSYVSNSRNDGEECIERL